MKLKSFLWSIIILVIISSCTFKSKSKFTQDNVLLDFEIDSLNQSQTTAYLKVSITNKTDTELYFLTRTCFGLHNDLFINGDKRENQINCNISYPIIYRIKPSKSLEFKTNINYLNKDSLTIGYELQLIDLKLPPNLQFPIILDYIQNEQLKEQLRLKKQSKLITPITQKNDLFE